MTRTLAAVVREHVDRDAAREVFSFRDLSASPPKDRALTYGELWAAARPLAEALADTTNPTVLLVLPLGPELLTCHVGALLAGGVPIIHSHPSAKVSAEVYARNLEHVVALIHPEVIVTSQEFHKAVQGAVAETNTRVVRVDDLPAHTDFEPTAWQNAEPDHVALLQHSSGSTGLQKGVALTHRQVLEQIDAYGEAIALDATTDRVASWIPLYHDMGLFTSWLMPLLSGVPVSLVDPFAWVSRPAAFLQLIADTKATLCWQPNFAYSLLAMRAHDDEVATLDLSSLRGVTNCSEPATTASQSAFLERFGPCGLSADALWVCYAMAENAFAVTAAGLPHAPLREVRVDPADLSRGLATLSQSEAATSVVSCGRPVVGCEVGVVDPQRAALDDAHVGEIRLRSPFALEEYHANPEASAQAVDADGWFYSGDLGFLLDGHLYVTGRTKDLLIVGGRNFYPQDLEAIGGDCPHAVPGRCVAVGVHAAELGTERIVVLVESRNESPAAHAELAAAVRRRAFEELDCPVGEVRVVPHMWLVKTSSGKLARRENLERYRSEFAAPVTPEPAPEPELSPARDWAESVAWALLIALVIYATLVLRPNPSWGIYAGF